MELAKVTSKGQVTIPKQIREILNLKEGSKIVFYMKNNEVIIQNAAMVALEKVQFAFEGEAERLKIESEEDVVQLVKKYRKEKR